MKNWMAELASYYEKTRGRYPQDRLMILFDIDGTILDMRSMILYVLQAYDRNHGNGFFRGRGSGENGNHYEYSMQLSRGVMTVRRPR